jgi:putative transposase
MTAPHIVDPARLLGDALSGASPDLMRHLLGTVINALLSAEADAVCGAEYGASSPDRVNVNIASSMRAGEPRGK